MIYLASQSPRRLELLRQIGIEPGLLDVTVPEVRLPGESPHDYVSRVAREKAGAGLLKVMSNPDALVLGADTEVVLGDRVFGKPADAADASQMLAELAGRTHTVISVVWLLSAGREMRTESISEVLMATRNDQAIAMYVATDEWRGKAGGYAVQGRAAAFIEHLSGSYSGVMGLPLFETVVLLDAFGVKLGMGNRDSGMGDIK
ncbi:MAG: nucleoside triphosphate pyrophosphatase [Lysobacteraceae bacterium]